MLPAGRSPATWYSCRDTAMRWRLRLWLRTRMLPPRISRRCSMRSGRTWMRLRRISVMLLRSTIVFGAVLFPCSFRMHVSHGSPGTSLQIMPNCLFTGTHALVCLSDNISLWCARKVVACGPQVSLLRPWSLIMYSGGTQPVLPAALFVECEACCVDCLALVYNLYFVAV